MDGKDVSSDQVIAEMLEMGFEYANIMEALKAVGLSTHSAVEFILNNAGRDSGRASPSRINNSKFHKGNEKGLRKGDLASSHSASYVRQSSILDHLQATNESTKRKIDIVRGVPFSRLEVPSGTVEEVTEPFSDMDADSNILSGNCKADSLDELDGSSDWEQKASNLLQEHFGFSCLKSFQKEALTAWVAHKDCLVLAATGSGKSLCFQIPALLSGKVVVVISPLISLMHDQCLKLARHGISACFLGSGQPDNTVERKAMRGMYSIVYVCPETVLRLIEPLQKLARSHGIALFAIDEVHCVSKWGHDFRPDYRRLSALRENFSTHKLEFLKFDIPLMALTATATNLVREDVLKSLHMSKETKIVLTSFFRPNLRFTVRHSGTSSSSYGKDFHELIELYGKKQKSVDKKKVFISEESPDVFISSDASGIREVDSLSPCDLDADQDDYSEGGINVLHSRSTSGAINGKELSVEYLENDIEIFQSVDDWDVACGEFCGQPSQKEWKLSEIADPPKKLEERLRLLEGPLERGPTIIYVPTRKETLNIAKYLCEFGVKSAAYNASLPKSHLRRVHKDFHENTLEVVVATVAFGMGIDKLNVRRIIHYGWPQSLEAYYQEAGRAGRDGKLADCILYANLSRLPSLLPSHRSEDQLKHAYVMLSDCFRCDVCVDGPPQMQNLREEACTLLQAVAEHYGQCSDVDGLYDDDIHFDSEGRKIKGRLSLNMVVRKIRGQSQKFLTTDTLWWRGLARVMEQKGYIREGDDKSHVQIKYPEPTEVGLKFVKSNREQAFYVYPEADMLLAAKSSHSKPYSSFSDWGKGWADPEIRRQRLQKMQLDRKLTMLPTPRKSHKRKAIRVRPDLRTCRGRLAAKLSKRT
ncbi:ATP-dependent DNA helicase Q-like SIM isoform X2 [Neltuma alba]|uniref:ATP-dependent DNA helicase Q-like SIM isoform X2 n=1 Tax=Neltuma alba TaxID=207710 RepID=UPI0010A3337E|nr:ATP-dependent DNA helicase Q-like SIM isoform X2 [Prosopis alba]